MAFNLQPVLEDGHVRLRPLRADDFGALYAVASDPLIWEQHPNPDRYLEAVFRTFFQGAMESGGAFLVSDAHAHEVIGSSRYYELDESAGSVAIGYTFLARRCWGGSYNRAMKTLMLDHAFRQLQRVIFHVGEHNRRSRIAMERLGAVYTGKAAIAYYGEVARSNVIYAIERQAWRAAPRPGP
jgi:RimJ/RimL family protein N-acetyltransferase